MYFITICTQNRENYFGDIANGQMQLTLIGGIVETEWLKTFEMRPDMNLWIGEYVVMPNHFHGIIGIGLNEYNTNRTQSQFGPQSKNLASIIRGFKIGVTKNARAINPDFAWQSRYHDHIIRNGKSFQTISDYIIMNPTKWQVDK